MPQTRNMATAALMVTAAALKREESRGGHFRSDFPQTDLPARRTFITLDEARAIAGAVSDVAAPELVPA
jgi:L-aspartate oxidase